MWHHERLSPAVVIRRMAQSVSFQELLVGVNQELKRIEDPSRIFGDSYESWLKGLKTFVEKLIEEINAACA
jgi:hypothetical protein